MYESANAATGKARDRTWSRCQQERGEIAVSRSGAGYCAEVNILEGTGRSPDEVVFVRAMQRQNLGDPFGTVVQEKDVCPICQGRDTQDNFVPGVVARLDGQWSR